MRSWAAAGLARGCSNAESGKHCSASSNLTEDEITYGGTSYDVDLIRYIAGDNQFSLTYSAALPTVLKEVAVLYVDGTAYPLSDASATALTGGEEALTFSTSVLSWSVGDTVTLELKRPAAPPSGVELAGTDLDTSGGAGHFDIDVTEGSSATFTIALSADPGTDATVTLLKTQFNQHGVGEEDHRWNVGAVTVAPETLTFTAGTSGNWNTPQTVTVSGVEDDDDTPEQLVVLILSPNRSEYDYVYVGEGNGGYNLNANGQYVWAGTGEGEYNYQQVDGYGPAGGAGSSVTGVSVTVDDDEAATGSGQQVVGNCGTCGTEGDLGVVAQRQAQHADLIAQMYEWRNDPQRSSYKSHTDRWDRALLAFGETVSDASLTPMTAAEAQAFADTSWGERWVPVAAALRELEPPPQEETYTDLIAQMKEWRNDPQWAHAKPHTDRWDRALLAFGETVTDTSLTPMTASEAQGFADRGWERWVDVAKALRELE